MTTARVRLHLPSHMSASPGTMPTFYARLLAGLESQGATTEVVTRDFDALTAPHPDGHFDFVHNGRLKRERLLNLGPAYLSRFHYVDPEGVFADSSLTARAFNPARVNADRARRFADQVRAELVASRSSRYEQDNSRTEFPGGHIAVFLQDVSDPVLRTRHMNGFDMVRTVLGHRGGRAVVIKPHPQNMGEETDRILACVAGQEGVTVTTANLHDILSGATVCVSINSAVAAEGMLHRVPAILFGRSDLHHCAETVTRAEDWPQALSAALARDWPFDAFLLWFLRWQNIWAARPFLGRVIERMESCGADLSALGITRPAAGHAD